MCCSRAVIGVDEIVVLGGTDDSFTMLSDVSGRGVVKKSVPRVPMGALGSSMS